MAAIMFRAGSPMHSFFKLFTLSLPFFCLLLTWATSTSTAPTSAVSILHSSGYSLFATLIASNATGTILVPPDFVFSSSKFSSQRRRLPPRPSAALLLYHTIDQPLTRNDLQSRADRHEFRTLSDKHCVFLTKNTDGQLSVSGSRKITAGVKIRNPDLYVDDRLIVHGVDGVLDLESATDCSSNVVPNPMVSIKLQMDRSLLDFGIRTLKRKGYSIVAVALTLRSFDLLNLNGITIFAPSDFTLFSFTDGFRYDFRHHVIPNRLRFVDIARLPAETAIETIDPYKTLQIGYVSSNVTINGVIIDSTEVYVNRWMVVISISRTFDDAFDNNQIPTPLGDGVYAPTYLNNGFGDFGIAVPSSAPTNAGESSAEMVQAGSPPPPPPTNYWYETETENATTSSSVSDSAPAVNNVSIPAYAVNVDAGQVSSPVPSPPSENQSEASSSVDVGKYVPYDAYNLSDMKSPISTV